MNQSLQAAQYRTLNSAVAPTLRRLYQEGFALVVLSNQKGIGKSLDGKRATVV
jgi:histidinol phosphatase-like enzyme